MLSTQQLPRPLRQWVSKRFFSHLLLVILQTMITKARLQQYIQLWNSDSYTLDTSNNTPIQYKTITAANKENKILKKREKTKKQY